MSVKLKHPSTSWSRRKFGAGVVVTALTALGLPLAATPASAAINPVPALPHSIISFPARDFISASGYNPGEATTVNVVRGGFVVGTADVAANADGIVEVNHPGGGCWVGVTPNIQAGDLIQVLTGAGTGDQTRTAGVSITQQATKNPLNASIVTIKGIAVSATGGQIPLAELESRVIAKNVKFADGKTSLRADSTGIPGRTISYDGASNSWTASFSGLNAADANLAVSIESRILWLGTNPGSGAELTIFEAGPTPADVVAGPAAPCTAPAAAGPTTPDMTVATDTGLSSVDNITSALMPTFGGLTTTVAATSAKLYVDGVPNGTGVVTGGRYLLTPSTPLGSGQHTVTVSEIAPAAPETMSNGSLTVTIDAVKPTVSARTPGANAMTASQIGNLSVMFSENVSGTAGSGFTLRKTSTGGLVSGAVAYSARTHTAILNPASTLLPSTVYTATLSSGIRDTAGNPLTLTRWSFKTGAAPTVTSIGPKANAIGVRRLANVAAIFSENVSGVSSTRFTLKRTSTGGKVAATVGYNWRTKVALLNPSSTLLPNTRYTATLSTLIRDADGNPITAKIWTFTTGRA